MKGAIAIVCLLISSAVSAVTFTVKVSAEGCPFVANEPDSVVLKSLTVRNQTASVPVVAPAVELPKKETPTLTRTLTLEDALELELVQFPTKGRIAKRTAK